MNLNNIVQYCKIYNLPDIFEGINVPAPLSKKAVRSAIMVKCGLLTPVFGEPDVLRQTITDWFFEKQWAFSHLVKILNAEYSPIENYDRYEDITDTHEGTGKDTHGGNDTRTFKADNKDIDSGTDTTTNEISAENASTYQADNKRTEGYGKITDYDRDETTQDSYGHTIDKKEDWKTVHTAHIHGNIGTTKNAEMILDDLNLIGQFDPYKWIAGQFENDFMIMIY